MIVSRLKKMFSKRDALKKTLDELDERIKTLDRLEMKLLFRGNITSKEIDNIHTKRSQWRKDILFVMDDIIESIPFWAISEKREFKNHKLLLIETIATENDMPIYPKCECGENCIEVNSENFFNSMPIRYFH